MHILSLDVGTTSMRGILYDREGREVACETVLTPLLIDQKKNTMEQDPLVYRRGAVQICRGIAARYPVDAVSVTAFRSTPRWWTGRARHCVPLLCGRIPATAPSAKACGPTTSEFIRPAALPLIPCLPEPS